MNKIKNITNTDTEGIQYILEKCRYEKNKSEDYILESRWTENIISFLKDDDHHGLALVENGHIHALLVYRLGDKSVYISLYYLDRKENASADLSRLFAELSNRYPDKRILVTELSAGTDPDLQARTFLKLGFEEIKRLRMERNHRLAPPDTKRPEGFEFKKFNRAFGQELVRLERRAYRGMTDEMILNVFLDIGNASPSLRIVTSGKKTFESRLSYFAFKDDRLAGAIICTRHGSELGIANIAVDPDYKKMGLGKILMYKSILGMRAHGYSNSALQVTADNHPAINLYKKFGFKLKRICPYFVYPLGQGAIYL